MGNHHNDDHPDSGHATPLLLQVQSLCFAYGAHPVFQNWSANVGAGATLLLGGDGCGKTTLLRLLAGAFTADAGQLLLAGVPVAQAAQARPCPVFWQDPRSDALDALTPQDWFATLRPQYSGWSDAALAAHIEGFALAPHLGKALHQLSVGSRRKVLMAAALASGAPLTLIDEPMAGLDRPSERYLQHALGEAARQPGRAVVVAHYEVLDGVPWSAVIALPDAAA